MAFKSSIEWTDATWNPFHGCHKISAGCKYCYMFRDKARYGQDPNTVVRSGDKTFYAPLKWKEPRRIFTCSWSDFFIEEADPWRDEAFAIMALTPQHTYQVLTKRPDRMYKYLTGSRIKQDIYDAVYYDEDKHWMDGRAHEIYKKIEGRNEWPLPNVWLGVSVEDQKTADERIPHLLNTPAAMRFLSVEPLLGPVRLDQFPVCDGVWGNFLTGRDYIDDGREVVHQGIPVQHNKIDWVIAGGESGPKARPMHPDWVRSIRDQCQAAGVPFFFKQWGEWVALAGQEPGEDFARVHGYSKRKDFCFPINGPNCEQAATMYKVGKKAAGRLLDGREHNEFPKENIDAARA